MALYTLADLHLAADVAKPMDIFGGRWQGHTEKIIKNWRALVAPEDTIVLGGDISWGINLAEAKGDFALIDSLPGKKIILKGNHDLCQKPIKTAFGFSRIDFYFVTDIYCLCDICITAFLSMQQECIPLFL